MDINQINLDNKFKLVEASAGTGKSFKKEDGCKKSSK